MAAAISAGLTLVAAGCGSDAAPGESQASFEVPGQTVFPEGVGVDHATGDFFVGSTNDGTIYRGTLDGSGASDAGAVTPFLAGGEDGRTAATGIKVDQQGRLWAAGRDTGRAWVYDSDTGDLIQALDTPPAQRTLINDLTFTPTPPTSPTPSGRSSGASSAPANRVGTEMTPWLDLAETIIPTDTEFGLNGVTASDDGQVLLTVHFDTGRLFRIDIATRQVTEIDLGGDLLTTGDGILLDGQNLLVVREEPAGVYPVRLNGDLTRGEVDDPFGEGLLLPTTIAEYDGEVLVVNSQLNDQDSPDLPFTVSRIPYPGTSTSASENPAAHPPGAGDRGRKVGASYRYKSKVGGQLGGSNSLRISCARAGKGELTAGNVAGSDTSYTSVVGPALRFIALLRKGRRCIIRLHSSHRRLTAHLDRGLA
ncbi:MAG: hypothetical protein WKF73_00830 [Nocardioidaceae bacterium]